MKNHNPFRYFKTSPEIIRLAVMMYVRFPLSLRNVEDLLHERGIDICHETVRYWWNKFGPMFAGEIRKKRLYPSQNHSNWRWHLDEVFVKINGETHYLWRAVDHEGEVLEAFVSKRRDRKAALVLLKKTMKRYGKPYVIVTDRLRSYRAAMKIIGNAEVQEVGRWKNNRCENSHLPFRRREQAMLQFRRLRSCRNSYLFMHPSITTSTMSATYTTEKHSNFNAMPRSPSGSKLAQHNRGTFELFCVIWRRVRISLTAPPSTPGALSEENRLMAICSSTSFRA